MPELMGISEDTLGLKDVVRRHSSKVQRVEIDAPEVLLDLNTPEDYHKALEILGPG
jgi:CTP:molybdopterin cytidylyltransferase MocA